MRLYVLLIAHMLADFALQTNVMARKKKKEFKFLLIHSAIYVVVMAVGCFSCMGAAPAFGMIILFGITHFLIDWGRTKYDSKYEKDSIKALGSFLVDQVLHIGIILLACWVLRDQKQEGWIVLLAQNTELKGFLREILWEGCTLDQLLRYSLLFVTIMDPASVLVKKLSGAVSVRKTDKGDENGENEGDDQEENHAGSLIGKLERLIIVLLVMYDGYGGIGLVLTAKSMARHDRLKDQAFAESYLVGTLSSTAIAMLLAQVLG